MHHQPYPTPRPAALHLLHGWWVASCPECGHELGRSRDQEAAERAGERRRCPICQPPISTPRGWPDGRLRRPVLRPRPPRPRPGRPLDPASDGWQPCRAPSHIWMDPQLVLRHVCVRQRRQLTALHAAGLADRIRWTRDGLATR